MDGDKDAIRDLLHLYCFHMDEGRFVELAALFAADGEWIAPYRSVRGPEAIAAWLTQSVPASPRRMHYVMNSVISVAGDEASAKSNYLVMVEGLDGPVPSVCGTYADALIRTPDGWRFHRRELIHAFKGEMRLTLPRGHLSLWKQALGAVPDVVWDRTDLQTLVLADNGLTEVSDRIGDLRNLRMLDLGHNKIRHIPESLGGLEGLTDFLYLHDNELAELPSSLRRLTRLRYLNISKNTFEVLPEAVTEMSGLIELRVTDNRLTSLPPSISALTRLRELHVRNNRLTTLPDAIGSLLELRQIDLRENPIASLPHSLLKLPRLEKLDLRWVDTLNQPTWFAQLESRGCAVYL